MAARCQLAEQSYRQSIESGSNPIIALTRADTVLYEGLIFSRFDTLRCILATEFPAIPQRQQRSMALKLMTVCKDIFAKYNLDDGLIQRSEYNHLIMELIAACRGYIKQNPIPRIGRPSRDECPETTSSKK